MDLNILNIKEKEILPVYISKHNSTREKQIMIPNKKKERWHYLAVKKFLHYYKEKPHKIMVIFIA